VPSSEFVASLLAALVCMSAAACGLGDVFASPGPHNVLLRYCGDTALQTGVPAPTRVITTVSGVELSSPRLRFTVSDTAVLTLAAGGDSVIGNKSGKATVTVQLESSILTDSFPTVAQPLRVSGGPASGPACP